MLSSACSSLFLGGVRWVGDSPRGGSDAGDAVRGEWVDRLIDCVSGEEWAKGNAAAAAAGAHCGVTISSPRNGAQNQEQEGKKKV